MQTRSLALIGAGYWGKNLARNFRDLAALHTICDLNPATLEFYTSGYDGIRKTCAIDSLWEDSTISAVAIASPAVFHFTLAKQALQAGKDVFVEKPLCLEASEAEHLISLAREMGKILMVGHLLQYHPLIQRLQQIAAAGELGAIHYISSNRLNLGKIRREENALWSFAPHDLSVILSLVGGELPEEVGCTGGAYLRAGVADTTLSSLRFRSGTRAHVYVSWLNPFKEQKLSVIGSKGMAVFDDMRPWNEKLVVYPDYLTLDASQNHVPTKGAGKYVIVEEAEPLRRECSHFLECCRERRTPRTDGQEGLEVLRVLRAAQASLNADGVPWKIT